MTHIGINRTLSSVISESNFLDNAAGNQKPQVFGQGYTFFL